MRYCFTFAFAFVFAAIISAQAGPLDLSFDPGQGANGPVYTVALQQDGKILIGGGFTTYDGEGRNGIARLTSNGALDPTFDPQFGFGNGAVSRLAIQSDGKVIAIGSFTTYNGVGRNRIARLNSDGGLDISYNPDIAFSFDPIAIALQPDGKALVHASVDGSARLLRLNGDGSSDGSFTAPAWGQLDKVYSIRILPDGKILMAGCTVSSGTLSSQARISRLQPEDPRSTRSTASRRRSRSSSA